MWLVNRNADKTSSELTADTKLAQDATTSAPPRAIERVQFPLNKNIHISDTIPNSSLSFIDWYLTERERIHATDNHSTFAGGNSWTDT